MRNTKRWRTLKSDAITQYSIPSISQWGAKRKTRRERALFDRFFPPLHPQSVVVEIGAGFGFFARECRRRGFDYLGIEASTDLCRQLHTSGFKTLNAEGTMLPLASGSADLIHAYDVLEHFGGFQEAFDFAVETMRVIKPGGLVSVITPNYETLGPLFYKYDYQHSFVTTRHRVERLLQDVGFEVVHAKTFLFNIGLTRFAMIDRILAHVFLIFLRNPVFLNLLEWLAGQKTVHRINKNMFDHIGVLARKPLQPTICSS